jgi:hypothetical protein
MNSHLTVCAGAQVVFSCFVVVSPLLAAPCQAQGGRATSGSPRQGATPAESGTWAVHAEGRFIQ